MVLAPYNTIFAVVFRMRFKIMDAFVEWPESPVPFWASH